MLTEQASALDNLRSRASTILAAAALITTFLGAQALAKPSRAHAGSLVSVTPHLTAWGWAAIAALFGVLGCTLWVLYPWKGWAYGQSATQMIREFEALEPPPDLELVQRATAMSLEQNFRDNEVKLERLSWAFRLACILTVAETALWIVNLESLP